VSGETLRRVFFQYALGMSYAQQIEASLIGFLVLRSRASSAENSSDAVVTGNPWERKTMGQLTRLLRKYFGPSQKFDERLRDATYCRNYLAHGFFIRNAEALAKDSLHSQLESELAALCELLRDLRQDLTLALERVLKIEDLSQADLEALVEEASRLGTRHLE